MIFLTYWNTEHTDGYGAQLQRILGIYAIAKAYKLEYIHTPVLKLGSQGLNAIKDDKFDDSMADRCEASFRLPSSIKYNPRNRIQHRYVKYINPEELKKLVDESNSLYYQDLVVHILYSHVMIDENPDRYLPHLNTKALYRWQGEKSRRSSKLRIAVHVRRGDLHFINPKAMLPNEYYIDIMKKISQSLKSLKVVHVFELYSEKSETFTVYPGDKMLGDNVIKEPFVMDSEKLDKFEEFDQIQPLEKYFNLETIETLKRLSTADILIMSKSSFSYTAAAINTFGLIFYHPFGHPPRSDWVNMEKEFTKKSSDQRCDDFVKARSKMDFTVEPNFKSIEDL
jgi:hypothetical protein